jgi:hypothetical protein
MSVAERGKKERNDMALKLFNKSWRQLDGFLRHAVLLALRATLLALGMLGCAAEYRKPLTHQELTIQRSYYGKPYLDAPRGWHWVCFDHYDRCWIDKNDKAGAVTR